MKEKIEALLKNKKLDSIIFILGIAGVALIFISTLSAKNETKKGTEIKETSFSAEEYRTVIESQIKQIVTGIAGDNSAVVTVTLETGMNYIYADETKQNTEKETDRQSEETEQTYITVTQADGTETPLILTEHMPKIRGVAIVCQINNEQTAQEIKNAVMAAFDLTSKRVYIAGRTNLQ